MVWLFLWYPWEFEMLDGSKFRLRQGFPCGETLVRRNAPPRRAGPRPASVSFSSTQDIKTSTPSGVDVFMCRGRFQMFGENA